ncbi:MAG: type II toxin-antitoxin system MqsA family antitoxin [Actinomycetota bacterium]|nr:type II toxin-antitoxin system MqsA family antitoxin [Actinomycetota bacterium]
MICKSETPEAGKTTLTLERGETLIIFRPVPAKICPNCGESYLDERVVESVHRAADEAARAGAEVDMRECHRVSA